MDIKYYDNEIKKGIIYDHKAIKAEYKKLGCPKDVYNPCKLPLDEAKYFALLSERSTGKTTNLLLLGMLYNWHYGTEMIYIRKLESMIFKKELDGLFKTIREYGYIEKVTGGRWNNCEYYAGKWRYTNIDENGVVVEKAAEHFMRCLAVNRREVYKSSMVSVKGDFIIYDEFISDRYGLNEFVAFCDLLKTVIRDRLSPLVFMLANTIDKHSEYFHEMEIYEEIQLIEVGKSEIIKTQKGTKVFVELIRDAKEIEEKRRLNTLFFGFLNPKISSITGEGWAISNYPHIERGYKTIQHGVYIEYHGRYLELEIVEYEGKGVYILVHRASEVYEDSVIYSNADHLDGRYRFHLGDGCGLDNFIKWAIVNHRILFQDNSCGTIFFNHVNSK